MPHVEQNDGLKDNNRLALGRYKFVIECLKDKSRNIIDLACGLGYGCHMLRQAGHKVMGVDKNKDAFNYCRSTYPGSYYLADIEKSDFEGFETAVCLEALCHLHSPAEFIKRIKTKELIISAPIDPPVNDGYIYRLHNLSKHQFISLLVTNGWCIIKEYKQKGYLTLYLRKL
jgi:SAM-dependent methyltransferase